MTRPTIAEQREAVERAAAEAERLSKYGPGKFIGHFSAEAKALSAAAETLAACEWRPIESAPRDGTPILLTGGVYGGTPFVGLWLPHEWAPEMPWLNAISMSRFYPHVPTHWTPLPTPPGARG